MSKIAKITPYKNPEVERRLAEAAAREAAVVARHRAARREQLLQAPQLIGTEAVQTASAAVAQDALLMRIEMPHLAADGLRQAVAALCHQAGPPGSGAQRAASVKPLAHEIVIQPLEGPSVELVGPPAAVAMVMQQYMLDRAIDHLQAEGRQVHVTRRENGEYEVVGKKTPQRKGTVTAMVKAAGLVDVDVSGMKGEACDQDLSRLARSVGGIVRASRRKTEYYQSSEPHGVRTRG